MNVRATTMAATLAVLALTGLLAVQAQDASPAPDGSPMPVESPGVPAESPGTSPGVEGSPGADEATDGATAGDGPHPAHIHAGACPEPGDVVAPLSDVMQPTTEMVGEGAEQVPLELSTTTVGLALQDILAGEHAINVHQSAEAIDVYIACGDIGSEMTGADSAAIVLKEQNGSGHSGFAWLTDQGDGSTRVDIVMTMAAAGTTDGATDGGAQESAATGTDTGAEGSPGAVMTLAPEASPAAGG